MRFIRYLILLVTATANASGVDLAPANPLGAGQRILPVEEAFALSAIRDDDGLEVRWLMPPGYYLYRHAFEVRREDGEALPFRLPSGEQKHDEFFGDVEVYFSEVVMEIPVTDSKADIVVRYQGCAEAGYCYPPRSERLKPEQL